MYHIGANSKNSFALDKDGNLYTWGSSETGLIGNESEGDINCPNETKVKNGYDQYTIEKLAVGQFHTAVIGKRKDIIIREIETLVRELSFAKGIFNGLQTWFRENIHVTNEKEFIGLMIPHSSNSSDIKYKEFEKLLLKPFFAYQKLTKKDFFHMNQSYKEIFSDAEVFALSNTKTNFKLSDVDNVKSNININPKLKDFFSFLDRCVKHFADFPKDFPFLCQFVFRFQPYINEKDLRHLFEYSSSSPNLDVETIAIIKKIMIVLNVNQNDQIKNKSEILKSSHLTENEKWIESNVLIDCILEQKTGTGVVFTWGVHTEGRLGYKDINEATANGDEVLIQRIPKMVNFHENTKILKIACGYSHTLALSEAKTVYAWGSSKYGCLGQFIPHNAETPILVENDSNGKPFIDIQEVAAGMYLSAAIDDKGRVFTWGLGNYGRLGHGDENSSERPKVISYFTDNDITIKQISVGDIHCAAISTSKEIYTWGNGNYGKLGHSGFANELIPAKIGFFFLFKIEFVKCGCYNTMAVTTDTKLYAWGKNAHGMLGIPHLQEQNILIPTEVQFQKDDASLSVSEIALGTMHSIILCTNGQIFTCGNTVCGILALNDVYDKVTFPRQIITPITFFETKHSEIMKDSPLFGGYCPDFTIKAQRTLLSTSIIYTDCSYYNTAFISNSGDLFLCGNRELIPEITEEKKKTVETSRNVQIESEVAKIEEDISVIKVNYFRDKVYFISLGKYHAICVADGKAYAWGKNDYGMCGITGKSISEKITKPTLIDRIKTNIKMSCVSDTHSMILTATGEIYAFGSNMYGKLGIGDLSKYFTIDTPPMEPEPMLVKNVTVAQYIACSNSHSGCIMKYDTNFKDSYSVYTWGSGYSGKLGHATPGDVYEPKKVEELDNKTLENKKVYFVKISLGDEFSLALDVFGRLWGWGKRKYLPYTKKENVEGKLDFPLHFWPDLKFKFIASSNHFSIAITDSGDMYTWGKVLIDEAESFLYFSKTPTERMESAACGFNHFASIDKSKCPYTWGGNLFSQCGYRNMKFTDFEIIPRRIETLIEEFSKNEGLMKNELEKKALGESELDKEKKDERDEIQVRLLDEALESKTLDLLTEDLKIHSKFYDTMSDYFNTLKIIEERMVNTKLDTENKIISVIKQTECKQTKIYKSAVPLILAKNFQLYESFLELLHSHPCYLNKLYDTLSNKKSFIDLCKLIYGKNYLNMRSKRILMSIMGLWNSMFKPRGSLLLNSERFEDSVIYALYEMIFKISEENMIIAYEMIASVFLLFITKIMGGSYVNIDKDADNFFIKFKSMDIQEKENIYEEAKQIIFRKAKNLFGEIKESLSNNYSFSVIWIFKNFYKILKKQKKEHKNNESTQKKLIIQFNRLVNFFLFQPCAEILKNVMDSHENNLPLYYYEIAQMIAETLTKSSSRGYFSQLYNDYKLRKSTLENVLFRSVCAPKSDLLKTVYQVFIDLSKSQDPIKHIQENLQQYEWDFTINALKDMVKATSERGNETFVFPLTIKSIVELQTNFSLMAKEGKLVNTDPLKYILDEMNDFNIEELESTSSINSNVLNLYIQPYVHFVKKDSNTLLERCSDCQLPIYRIFIPDTEREEIINGKPWECKREKEAGEKCGMLNSEKSAQCSSCKGFKTKENIKEDKSFFKKFYLPAEDWDIIRFEEVLYSLQPLYKHDDILKEVGEELGRLRRVPAKNREREKIENLDRFKNALNHKSSTTQRSHNAAEFIKEYINGLKNQVRINLDRRKNHFMYLRKIKDVINYITTMSENTKSNFAYFYQSNSKFASNVMQGYVSQFFYDKNRIAQKLRLIKPKSKEGTEKKVLLKRYLVKNLIENQVIREILFDKKDQAKLVQKSFIDFEKVEEGFRMKLSYNEKYRKYILCGTSQHDFNLEERIITNEYILLMRRLARNNPVAEFGEVSFNVFYLVQLLNSLQNE